MLRGISSRQSEMTELTFKKNAVVLILVHESWKVGAIRDSINAMKEGCEVTDINDETPPDTEVKDIKVTRRYSMKKAEENNQTLEPVEGKQRRQPPNKNKKSRSQSNKTKILKK